MRLVFINLSIRPGAKLRFLPVGLGYVMTAVKKAGFDFDLIDMDINNLSMQDLKEILTKKIYDVYAFGCIVTGFKFAKQIAKIIKEVNPKATIIAGNSVASSIPEILLTNTLVDIGVIGEADITMPELLNKLRAKENIVDVKGIVFKKDSKVNYTLSRPIVNDIDEFGFPDWNIFDLKKYTSYGPRNINGPDSDNVVYYPLNSARGCPFNCTFCYHVFKGQRYRRYSEKAVIEEIKRLHSKYDCNFVSFWDELSFSTIKGIEAMVKELSKLNFKIEWEITTRGDLFKKEHLGLIEELRDLGCRRISFSLENASPEILKAINKRMNISQFIEQAKVLWEGGIVPLASVIFGYPQETPQTIRDTIRICEECNIYPSVGYLLPLPKTPVYEWARQQGFISDEVAYLERIGDRQDFHINLTKMPDQEFISLVETGLKDLAKKQGLKLDSVLKTTTYQKPQTLKI